MDGAFAGVALLAWAWLRSWLDGVAAWKLRANGRCGRSLGEGWPGSGGRVVGFFPVSARTSSDQHVISAYIGMNLVSDLSLSPSLLALSPSLPLPPFPLSVRLKSPILPSSTLRLDATLVDSPQDHAVVFSPTPLLSTRRNRLGRIATRPHTTLYRHIHIQPCGGIATLRVSRSSPTLSTCRRSEAEAASDPTTQALGAVEVRSLRCGQR